MRICSIEGCDGKHIARGLCHKHYLRIYKRTYTCWKDMKRRCTNPSDRGYKHYGERGISVCDRWMKYENFLQDMGEIPPDMTLERIDNSRGYSPDNCRWATQSEQKRNTRQTRIIDFNGKRMCIVDWAKYIGIKSNTLERRILNGWSIERALNEKVGGE